VLDVAVAEQDEVPLAQEGRAIIKDRLSVAGLDVRAPRVIREGGYY